MMHCCAQCPQPSSRPPPTHTSTGDSWTLTTSLGQSLVGSLLLSPGFCCAQGSVCALQESVFQSCVSSSGSMVGLLVTSCKRAYAIPRSAAARAPALRQAIADPHLCRRYSDTVLAQSLWGPCVLVCARYVWALWASLAGMGFDSKCDFTSPTILVGLLLCPCTWGNLLKVTPAPHSCCSSAGQPWSQMFIRNQLLKYNMHLKVKNESPQWQFTWFLHLPSGRHRTFFFFRWVCRNGYVYRNS